MFRSDSVVQPGNITKPVNILMSNIFKANSFPHSLFHESGSRSTYLEETESPGRNEMNESSNDEADNAKTHETDVPDDSMERMNRNF